MRREYYLNIFYQDGGFSNGFTRVQEIPDNINSLAEICLELYACDFNPEQSLSSRKKLYTEWQDLLPKLDNIKALYLRHKVDQNFFEAICRMKGLEKLCFRNSNIEDLSSIKKLKKLKLVSIDSFSKLTNIEPLNHLTNLELLSIENSFNISNYDLIGNMIKLKGLRLIGDTISPKNLRLKSLKPFRNLKNLVHLDLSNSTVADKSYNTIIELENLERFDITTNVPKEIRDLIKTNHKKLEAGFFMDWDYDNKNFYKGKEWWTNAAAANIGFASVWL